MSDAADFCTGLVADAYAALKSETFSAERYAGIRRSTTDGRALQDVARARALELPAAVISHMFGPEYEVVKVAGTMFLLLTEVSGGRASQPARPRRTISSIQSGANGEVQFGGVG